VRSYKKKCLPFETKSHRWGRAKYSRGAKAFLWGKVKASRKSKRNNQKYTIEKRVVKEEGMSAKISPRPDRHPLRIGTPGESRSATREERQKGTTSGAKNQWGKKKAKVGPKTPAKGRMSWGDPSESSSADVRN